MTSGSGRLRDRGATAGGEGGHVDDDVRVLPEDRLRAQRHAAAGRLEQIDVVGAVAHADGLLGGEPRVLGPGAQHGGLRRAVHDVAEHLPRQVPVPHLELVGAVGVHAPRLGQRGEHLGEAAGDRAHPAAGRGDGLDQREGSVGGPDGPHHVRHDAHGQPRERLDARVQRGGEVELTAHRPLRHLGDLGLAAGVGGEQLDDLLPDQRGVHVRHHEGRRRGGDRRRHREHVPPGARLRGRRPLVRGEAPAQQAVVGEPFGVVGHAGRGRVRDEEGGVGGDDEAAQGAHARHPRRGCGRGRACVASATRRPAGLGWPP